MGGGGADELVAAHGCLVRCDESVGEVKGRLVLRVDVRGRRGPFDHVRLELCEAEGEPERYFGMPLSGRDRRLDTGEDVLICWIVL